MENNLLDFSEGIDTIEQERYITRLNNANKRQNAIFDWFMKNYYFPMKVIENQKQKLNDINENSLQYQARQYEIFNKQNKILSKINYQQQLKEQIKTKYQQKLLQESIKKDIRKEIELKK